ncbi:MAG: Co2+/Mg2+ efflux protein ApaG [Rhodospirillales bacterium]
MLNQGGQETPYFTETTRAITIQVRAYYLDDQSSPDDNLYVWAYHVRIENNGNRTVKLLNRFWSITDETGNSQEVRGEGVVGEQPVLAPGESFEYTSGTPLPTPSGFMVGAYQMIAEDGEEFDAKVPAFSLDSPHQKRQLH